MALSANEPLVQVGAGGYRNSVPCGSALTAYEGAMIGESDGDSGQATAGYGEPLVAGDTFLGHSIDKVDNSAGGDGGKNIEMLSGRYRLKVTITGVAITNVGATVYASDDATLTLAAGANSAVGIVTRYLAANTCEVEFRSTP